MKKIINPHYLLGNLGNPQGTAQLLHSIPKDIEMFEGPISDEDYYDTHKKHEGDSNDYNYHKSEIRSCRVGQISNRSPIGRGIKAIIEGCNKQIWNLKLKHAFDSPIQYIVYDREGDHFHWHKDEDKHNDRKLSISFSLSHADEYEGGDLEISSTDWNDRESHLHKLDFGDFIVFPADRYHRVHPVTSGVRKVLVAWYR